MSQPFSPEAARLVQRLEGSEALKGYVQRLTPIFFNYEKKRVVIAEIGAWADAEARAANAPRDELEAVRDAVVGAAVQAAMPSEGPSTKPAPGARRARHATILTSYPYPVARAFSRSISSDEDPTSRYGALLDTFESLLIFLIHTQVSHYLRGNCFDPALNRQLVELLIRKSRLSTGDWASLLMSSVKAYVGREGETFFPELTRYLFDGDGKPTRSAEIVAAFCHIRNRSWGHSLGRSAELYEGLLDQHLTVLEHELVGMRFLEGTQLVVPTRFDGSTIVEGRVFLGSSEPEIDVVDIPIKEVDLPDRGGWVRLHTSILLYKEGRGYAPLFPFFRYRDAAERMKRGIYYLTGMDWIPRGGRHRLKKATFVPQKVGADPESDPEAQQMLERAFGSLLAQGRPEDYFAPVETVYIDPDHSIATVWSEQRELDLLCVGREDTTDEVVRSLASRAATGGIIIVKGVPGMGKSSFLARLYGRLDDFQPLLHMVRASKSPKAFLRALIYQCGIRLDRALGAEAYSGETVEELRTSLEHRMIEVAREKKGRCVALIDGLDELDCDSGDWERALEWLPRIYAPGVLFVVSCRPEASLLQALRARIPQNRRVEFDLPPLTISDLGPFLEKHLGKGYAARCSHVVQLDELFGRIGGHPLFLRSMLEEVAAELRASDTEGRPPRRLDLATLPTTAREQMARVCDQLVGKSRGADRAERRLRRRLLEYLSCAQSPGLSVALLRPLLELSSGETLDLDEVSDLISSMSSYLRELVPGRYLPFHASLAEHVLGQTLSNDDRRQRHAELARLLISRGPREDPSYWQENATFHAWEGGMPPETIAEHLLDSDLIAARLSARRGALHGNYVKKHLARVGASEVSAFIARLVSIWGPGSARFRSLSIDDQEEVAEIFKASAFSGLWGDVKRIYGLLHEQTGEVRFLTRRAWVCYQALDEWQEARELLTASVRAHETSGRVLEAALSRRLLAAILFDLGVVDEEPYAILEHECLPAFVRLGLGREQAATYETMAVVVDAEARWEEALSLYGKALEIYTELQDDEGLGRVRLNRSIALLFTQGLVAARVELEEARRKLESAGMIQALQYCLVNRCMVALLSNDQVTLDQSESLLSTSEQWVLLGLREAKAMRAGFDGKIEAALESLETLTHEFEALGDAWGPIDNRINAGMILLSSRPEEARALLAFGHAESCKKDYRVGAAIAAEGLRRLGEHGEGEISQDLAFYRRHLEPLFKGCPQPFVPCYLLALP